MLKNLVEKIYFKVCKPITKPDIPNVIIDRTNLTHLRAKVSEPHVYSTAKMEFLLPSMKREVANLLVRDLLEKDCFEVEYDRNSFEVTVYSNIWVKEWEWVWIKYVQYYYKH